MYYLFTNYVMCVPLVNDQVNLTLLNENGELQSYSSSKSQSCLLSQLYNVVESTVKSIILQKSEKLGLFLSYGLPPAIVTYVEPGTFMQYLNESWGTNLFIGGILVTLLYLYVPADHRHQMYAVYICRWASR